MWRSLSQYLKSWLCLHLPWQLVCPTCWGLMSYTNKLGHPADLTQIQMGIAEWHACEEQVGTRLVFHSVFMAGQVRSSLACGVFSAAMGAEGWVISGWTGTNCRGLPCGVPVVYNSRANYNSPALMWSWTSFKSSVSLLSSRILQFFPHLIIRKRYLDLLLVPSFSSGNEFRCVKTKQKACRPASAPLLQTAP